MRAYKTSPRAEDYIVHLVNPNHDPRVRPNHSRAPLTFCKRKAHVVHCSTDATPREELCSVCSRMYESSKPSKQSHCSGPHNSPRFFVQFPVDKKAARIAEAADARKTRVDWLTEAADEKCGWKKEHEK